MNCPLCGDWMEDLGAPNSWPEPYELDQWNDQTPDPSCEGPFFCSGCDVRCENGWGEKFTWKDHWSAKSQTFSREELERIAKVKSFQ